MKWFERGKTQTWNDPILEKILTIKMKWHRDWDDPTRKFWLKNMNDRTQNDSNMNWLE